MNSQKKGNHSVDFTNAIALLSINVCKAMEALIPVEPHRRQYIPCLTHTNFFFLN